MKKKIKWLFSLWKREWKSGKEELLHQLYVELGCVCFLFLLYIMNRSLLNGLFEEIMAMPKAVYAFWELPEDAAVEGFSFYIQWIMMPLNVWIIWKCCNRSIRIVWAEEEKGAILALCNQWYNRYQIGVAKYTWSVISYIIYYTVLFAVNVLLLLLGDVNNMHPMAQIGDLFGMYVKGMVVTVMLISVCNCYAMTARRKQQTFCGDILVVGMLLVGNLYKVRDLIVLLIERAHGNYTGVRYLFGWLDGLRWLSPLGWLNPYIHFGTTSVVVQVVICLMVTVLMTAVGLLGYRVRKFA